MSELLLLVVGLAAIVGALDSCIGNRFGLGSWFEEGFQCMGASALAMCGMISLTPFIKLLLSPIADPIASFCGFDPSLFASLLANNMGGYTLAMQLAKEPQLGLFFGIIVSSMLGATLVYSIPVGLQLLGKEKHSAYAKGMMIGMIPIPIGACIAGCMMGLPFRLCIINLLPIALLSLVIIIGFWKYEAQMMIGFTLFSKGLQGIILLTLGITAFQAISGITIWEELDDIYTGLQVVMEMSVMQLGLFPLLALLLKFTQKPLMYIGNKVNIGTEAISAIIACWINAISAITMMKTMKDQDIVIVSAALTSMICVFSAHLSFTVTMTPSLLLPMVAAKLSTGLCALFLAKQGREIRKTE